MNAVQEASPTLQLNNWQLARSFFVSPSRGFAELKHSPRNALPLWLLLIGSVIVIQWYFNSVDFDWLKDQLAGMFAARGARGAAAVQAVSFVSRGVLKWSTTITTTIATILILALEALYLLLIGMVARIRYSYGQWFAFVCWSATPLIIGLIPQMLMLAFAHVSQADLNTLQPLSLNELFFHDTAGDPGYRVLTSLSLLTVAQVWLSIVGLRVWSGRTWGFCTIYMLVPHALYFGALALAGLRQ